MGSGDVRMEPGLISNSDVAGPLKFVFLLFTSLCYFWTCISRTNSTFCYHLTALIYQHLCFVFQIMTFFWKSLFIWEPETIRSPMHWFTPQKPRTPGLGANSWSPTWVSDTQVFLHALLPSMVHISRELESRMELDLKSRHCDAQCICTKWHHNGYRKYHPWLRHSWSCNLLHF